jgi:hypothetical protein
MNIKILKTLLKPTHLQKRHWQDISIASRRRNSYAPVERGTVWCKQTARWPVTLNFGYSSIITYFCSITSIKCRKIASKYGEIRHTNINNLLCTRLAFDQYTSRHFDAWILFNKLNIGQDLIFNVSQKFPACKFKEKEYEPVNMQLTLC